MRIYMLCTKENIDFLLANVKPMWLNMDYADVNAIMIDTGDMEWTTMKFMQAARTREVKLVEQHEVEQLLLIPTPIARYAISRQKDFGRVLLASSITRSFSADGEY